jgi:hypothetical protein
VIATETKNEAVKKLEDAKASYDGANWRQSFMNGYIAEVTDEYKREQ